MYGKICDHPFIFSPKKCLQQKLIFLFWNLHEFNATNFYLFDFSFDIFFRKHNHLKI